MENLFSEDPQFRRVQYKKLSDNVREWQQEIAALVAEKLPKDLGLDVVVTFQKVDDEKGYAVGSAVTTDPSSGITIGIPIVVKSWHLAPIDLFFREQKVFPLTDENLAKVFYQSSLGAGLAPENPPPNMADDAFAETRSPPMGGKYSYSAPHSMISAIAGTLGAEDLKLFKTAVESNPRLMGAFHRHGTDGLLHKLAVEAAKPTEQDASNKERASEVFTVKKDGPNAYRMFSAPDEVYDPVMISTDRQGLKRFLEMRRSELWDYEQDPMNSIDQYGHFTVIPPETVYGKEVDGPSGNGVDGSGSYGAALGVHRNPWVFDPLQDDRIVRTVDKFGRYGVKDADGVMAKGWVIPNVVDFDGASKPIKLFLGKSLASMQGRIAGIPLNDDADVTLAADRPDTGKTGTLVYRDGEKIFATVPFQVTSVTVFKNLRSLGVIDYQGKQANLIISPNIDGIVAVTAGQKSSLGPLLGPGKNYVISAKMFFVRMPRLCQVSEGPDDFKRMAAAWLDTNPIKVAQANGRFIFKGGQIAKYANPKHLEDGGLGRYTNNTPTQRDLNHANTDGAYGWANEPKTLEMGGFGPISRAKFKAVAAAPRATALQRAGFNSRNQPTDPVEQFGPAGTGWPRTMDPNNKKSSFQRDGMEGILGATTPKGDSVQKVAFDFNSLARHEAEFLLGYWGLGREKVAEVLDKAKDHIRLEVHHLRFPKTAYAVKTASSPKVKAYIDSLRAPIADLLKCAASIDDAQAVDAVLSIGFINEENISRFASAKPMLVEVSQMLAKLLLASRLGMEDIPEENVRAALMHIQRIVSGLERLTMLGRSQMKTAGARPAPAASHVGGRLTPTMSPFGFVR